MSFSVKDADKVRNQKKFIRLLKIWFQMVIIAKFSEGEIIYTTDGSLLEMNFEKNKNLV